jgi:hypothetical protein
MQQIQALPYEITLITNNLPSGYHEVTIVKEGLFPAIQNPQACLDIAIFSIKDIKVKTISLQIKIRLPLYSRYFKRNGRCRNAL